MQKTATLSDYKLEGMASILESTLNGIIQLSEVVMDQFNGLDTRLRVLEGKETASNVSPTSVPSPEYTSTPPVPSHSSKQSPKTGSRKKAKKVREAVLDELKELLEKKGRQT
jgi:hypothetical protein